MYSFVESWIPQLFGFLSDPYPLADNLCAYIISKDDTNIAVRLLTNLHTRENESSNLQPQIISSSVAGMHVIFMKYWIDESILYSLTDGHIKESSVFRYFMGLGNPRFNLERAQIELRQMREEEIIRQNAYEDQLRRQQAEAVQQLRNIGRPNPSPFETRLDQLGTVQGSGGQGLAGGIIGAIGNISAGIGGSGGGGSGTYVTPIPPIGRLTEMLGAAMPSEAVSSEGPSPSPSEGPSPYANPSFETFSESASVNELSNEEKLAEELLKDMAPKEKNEVKKTNEQFIDQIYTILAREGVVKHVLENGLVVLHDGVTDEESEAIIKLARQINKNVIMSQYYHIAAIKNFLKNINDNDVYKHTVIIDPSPSLSNDREGFVAHQPVNSRGGNAMTICLGEEIRKHYIITGSDVNEKINKIRTGKGTEEEKEKAIQIILQNRENSPFFKYDCIFKDTYTNIIFAVRNRCIITLLFQYFDEEGRLLFKVLTELARRINMNVPYEELIAIDKKYFSDLNTNNMETYVKFSLEASKSVYKSIEHLHEEQKALFKQYMDKAMEAAKLMQRYSDQLGAFDMKRFEELEKEKALRNYNDTMAINKVSAIYIREGTVHVYTKNLYVKDERSKKWHDIGTFHITIGMLDFSYNTNNTVRIFNTKFTGGMGMNTGFHAPHVFEDGHACHGNLATGMVEAYRQRNLFDLVYQILIFLQTANTSDGAGQHVNTWPEVPESVALGEDHEEFLIYEKKKETEKKFDDLLADALPVRVTI